MSTDLAAENARLRERIGELGIVVTQAALFVRAYRNYRMSCHPLGNPVEAKDEMERELSLLMKSLEKEPDHA